MKMYIVLNRGVYDVDNNDYDNIYFCIKQERYIVYTDRDIYEFSRNDTVQIYDNTLKYCEMYIQDISIGELEDIEGCILDGLDWDYYKPREKEYCPMIKSIVNKVR